jgi:hypothetical protein
MADFQLEQVQVVRFGKHVWTPELKQVDGRTFICISKWCRQFFHFATGKPLDFRKDHAGPCNMTFINTLIRLRKQAAVDAISRAIQHDEEDDADKPSRGKRKKVSWQVILSSELLGPQLVDIRPCGHQMTVISELRSPSIWVEFLFDNLDFIRKGVKDSYDTPMPKRQRKGKKAKHPRDDEVHDDDDDDGESKCSSDK